MSWEMVRLDDICNAITCGVAKRPEYQEHGVPFLSSLNVKENRFILKSYKYISELDHEQLTKYNKPENGDILYTRVGSFGEAAVIDLDFDFSIFVSLTLIKPNQKLVDSRFLMWHLNSPNVRNFATRNTSGIGVQNLNVGVVREFQIPLPPLPIQKRIAEILDAADALRRKDQELLKKYDELAQAIFIDMFGDPVKNEKGWEVKTIEQLVKNTRHSIKRGPFGGALKKEIFVNDGFLVYEQFHALNNDFNFERYYINQEKYNELIAFDVKPKDIIISCSGIYLGKLAIVPEGAKTGIINQALLKLTLDENIYKNEFFVKIFTQDNFKETYFASERGAAIPNFPPMSTFKEFKFICPPINIQNEYLKIVHNLQQQIDIISLEHKTAHNLFQTLLQKAFKGELSESGFSGFKNLQD
ncbi:MAG: restriction endonuclease subunit S [Saprospiraceae bacterium]|nr:restriction endonuclease subunit S [Saprospiraceae bacterium]MBK7809767.1 restriction endonuclease subunit S [Saprospiraceae bacterium]MBK9632122.1 restriction endonuclease subunit S [Saprospiraceae bacterium]